jgi:hypothetical protein
MAGLGSRRSATHVSLARGHIRAAGVVQRRVNYIVLVPIRPYPYR